MINQILNAAPLYCGEGNGFEALGQRGAIAAWLSNGDGHFYLGNAFSLQMVADTAIISVQPCSPEDIPADAVSIIGHADTAKVVSGILGREIPFNRASVRLESGDVLFVAQLTGGRLPEGATDLPEGFSIVFRKVVVR